MEVEVDMPQRYRKEMHLSPAKLQPRFVRLRDAAMYLGMDKNRFDKEVRPCLIAIPIGIQGIAFDRLDLDAWADDYKSRNGRPAERRTVWDAENHQASKNGADSGGLISESKDMADWQKAVEQATSKRRSDTSLTGLKRSGKPRSTEFGRHGR